MDQKVSKVFSGFNSLLHPDFWGVWVGLFDIAIIRGRCKMKVKDKNEISY